MKKSNTKSLQDLTNKSQNATPKALDKKQLSTLKGGTTDDIGTQDVVDI